MDIKSQIEFRRMLGAYVQRCGEQGFDQNVVIGGMLMMETWIDQYADKKLFNAVKKDIKTDVPRGTS